MLRSDLSLDEVASASAELDELYHAVTLNHAIIYAEWCKSNRLGFNNRTAARFTKIMPGMFPGIRHER